MHPYLLVSDHHPRFHPNDGKFRLGDVRLGIGLWEREGRVFVRVVGLVRLPNKTNLLQVTARSRLRQVAIRSQTILVEAVVPLAPYAPLMNPDKASGTKTPWILTCGLTILLNALNYGLQTG